MKKLICFLGILLGLQSAAVVRAEKSSEFWFNYPDESESWRIMFPAPIHKELYQSTATAVEILELVCDGTTIEPRILGVVNAPRLRAVTINDSKVGFFVYQCTLGFLESWGNLSDSVEQMEMRHYDIKPGAKIILIKYRIRYPDGSKSQIMESNYIASNQDAQLLDDPTGALSKD